jgi:hypothetical protein
VLRLRKELADRGLGAGADTIGWHLEHHHHRVLSRATINRVLVRALNEWTSVPVVYGCSRGICGKFERPMVRVSEVRERTHQASYLYEDVLLGSSPCRHSHAGGQRCSPGLLLKFPDHIAAQGAVEAMLLPTATLMQVTPTELWDLLRHTGLHGPLPARTRSFGTSVKSSRMTTGRPPGPHHSMGNAREPYPGGKSTGVERVIPSGAFTMSTSATSCTACLTATGTSAPNNTATLASASARTASGPMPTPVPVRRSRPPEISASLWRKPADMTERATFVVVPRLNMARMGQYSANRRADRCRLGTRIDLHVDVGALNAHSRRVGPVLLIAVPDDRARVEAARR